MPTETESHEIEIHIDYSDFIAGRELSEVLELLDASLWHELLYDFDEPFLPARFFLWREFPRIFDDHAPSLFCVKETSKGSIVITALIGGAAFQYCFARFAKGFRPKRFGIQFERLGRIAGDHLEIVVDRMNSWLEEYVQHAREKGSHIKSIKAKRKRLNEGDR